MNARIAYIASWMKREWPLRPPPSPPESRTSERPSEQLGGRSHYCASLTPASDLPRRGRADFPERFPRPLRGTNAASKDVRTRGERPRGTPRGHLAERADYRVTVPRRIR
ncbi:hypothetical protein P5V15_009594 [Pogonomyrmex californicus]